MKIRNTVLAISTAILSISASYATTGTTLIGGEVGYTTHAASGSLSGERALTDLAAFRANPVLSDGVVVVGGEVGYVSALPGADAAPHTHAKGTASHSHVLGNVGSANTPAQPGRMTETERRGMREQYAY